MGAVNLALLFDLPDKTLYNFGSFEKKMSHLQKKIDTNTDQLISAVTRNYELCSPYQYSTYSLKERLHCGVITNTTHFPRSQRELSSSMDFIYDVLNPHEILLPGNSIIPSQSKTGFVSPISPENLLSNMNDSVIIPENCRITGLIENLPRLEIYIGNSEVMFLLGKKFRLLSALGLDNFLRRQIPYHLLEQESKQREFEFYRLCL